MNAKPPGRLREYALLMRLDKPVGIGLLLWPTLWALWIAGEGRPDLKVLVVFVLGVVLMRSAGCVINDYADRGFDPHVTRTRDRPIAAGRVSPREALVLFALLCLAAFALVLTLDWLTVALSVPAVLLAASYPFMKRWTYLPQAYLGIAFSWGIPMAFAAQTGGVPALAWWLFAANLLWAVAYDTFYALVDIADDRRIGVKSSAILFGSAVRPVTALLQLLVLGCLAWVGIQSAQPPLFYAGLAVAAGCALYQQWLIRALEPTACFRAFRNNNLFGAAVFVGLFAGSIF
ncbi:MAG TPA: 4-hydroxybenzoate octaprenyltransferase [Nevskiales bacterium]|nr:4-hydroxybenzoate octaprenyltransferase [Nevskiales bacterium]